jgi:hypothetical protein
MIRGSLFPKGRCRAAKIQINPLGIQLLQPVYSRNNILTRSCKDLIKEGGFLWGAAQKGRELFIFYGQSLNREHLTEKQTNPS